MDSRMEWDDEMAVARVQAGDTDAFRALVERHSRALFRLAFRVTGNEQDAEDIVQESLLRAYRQIGKFDRRASFGTWVHRIAVNCSLDLVRTRSRRMECTGSAGANEETMQSLPSPGPSPDRLTMSGEARERIEIAMARLTVPERTAFVLRHFEGMGIEEVSRVLGCQPGAAKHSVFRAVQKLRKALEPLVSTAR